MGEVTSPPAVFVMFRDLVRIHLKQILNLDQHTTKVPMYTVALLVMIAYEALARYTAPPTMQKVETHWLFAKRHYDLYSIDPSLGRCIFDAIRNGLAHTYGAYPVPVDGLGEVRFVLTWKDGADAHLKGVASKMVNGHQWLCPLAKGSSGVPGVLCVDVGSLWRDLDALFAEIEANLSADQDARSRFEALVMENRKHFTDKLKGSDPEPWRALLSSRRLEEDA